MCLITCQETPKIAEYDIHVYKLLRMIDINHVRSAYYPGPGGLIIPGFHLPFVYTIGELYRTALVESSDSTAFDGNDNIAMDLFSDTTNVKYIGSGFHAAVFFKRLLEECIQFKDISIYGCTIPADSEYYMDVTSLIVSNQIIVDHLIKK